MADLPDIDTSNVSILAYWNAIDDGGVGTIDPEEATSNGNIVDYTLYDNGIQGTFDLGSTLSYANVVDDYHATFRIKSDGWMVAWLDRAENFTQQYTVGDVDNPGTYVHNVKGWWDFTSWFDHEGHEESSPGKYNTADAVDNRLAAAINSLRQELSNSGSMTYNTSVVGLYHYWYPDATTLTLLSSGITEDGDTYGFSYTSSTTIEKVVVTSSVCNNYGDNSDFEGYTVANVGDTQLTTLDAVGEGLIPNSGTEYQHTVGIANGGYNGIALSGTYALWS